jgi:hypothetical protein
LQNNARAAHSFDQGEATTLNNEAVTRVEKEVTRPTGTGQPHRAGETFDHDSRSHAINA